MYERFTDRSRRIMQLANQEAQRFSHEYIGTEHILLGLIKEGSGVAANVLKNLDVDLRKIRLEVEKLVQSGPDMVTMGKLPMTPRAKNVIDLAMAESKALGHAYLGCEHILLGLLREDEGVAAQVLKSLGLSLESIREGVLELLSRPPETEVDEEVASVTGTWMLSMLEAKKSTPERFADYIAMLQLQVTTGKCAEAELEKLRELMKRNPTLGGVRGSPGWR